MNLKIVIRNERDDDVSSITEVTIAAFKTLAISTTQSSSSSRRCALPMPLRYPSSQK